MSLEKYYEIKLVERSNFTLNDIYLGYSDYWDIIEEIGQDLNKIDLYNKEVDTLYLALDAYIRFRSNYKKTLKSLIKE